MFSGMFSIKYLFGIVKLVLFIVLDFLQSDRPLWLYKSAESVPSPFCPGPFERKGVGVKRTWCLAAVLKFVSGGGRGR